MSVKGIIEREGFSKLPTVIDVPNLLDVQLESFRGFLQHDVPDDERRDQGLEAVFRSIFPITDVYDRFSLEYVRYSLGSPKYSVDECWARNITYSVPLRVLLRLIVKGSEGDFQAAPQQWVYLGELPMITERGTFIINGAERVIVNQLHRSPGVFFDETVHPNGKRLYSARIIPYRGSWVEFDLDVNDVMYIHIDRRRKLPVTVMLRALGCSSNDEIIELFYDVEEVYLDGSDTSLVGRTVATTVVEKETGEVLADINDAVSESLLGELVGKGIKNIKLFRKDRKKEARVLESTFQKDPTSSEEEALYRIYSSLRPGDPPNLETARLLLERLFFNPKRYDLGEVGRYRINQRLNIDVPLDCTVLTREDFVEIIRYLLRLRDGSGYIDDIDHLGNRRVRTVGEQLANQFSIGLSRMARTIRERMSLRDTDSITPQELVNARTVSAVINAFFGSSQLSQFMDQTNPLAELAHKRRLSALGPGGLTRERAGFEVRDVHHTHYGRMCPIETPEGPNIGLITSLSTYARINRFGFLETPYRKVENGRVTERVKYLTADEEDRYTIAQANTPLDEEGCFVKKLVKARRRGDFMMVSPEDIDYIDVSPKQLVSVAAALIPFLEHDDANRALMGSNMQRQAVPLLKCEAPLVGTGMEKRVALDSGALVVAENSGEVIKVTADEIVVKVADGEEEGDYAKFSDVDVYRLMKFRRSNQGTCISQKPLVRVGDKVAKGQVLADGAATERGELALGRNILAAFIPWSGYNFEDAIVISERLVQKDIFTSIHVEAFELQVRDTKRGVEEITREIPNVSEEAIRNLDSRGIVRVGAEVEVGDVLVGKVTPKGETELSPEERLLRAIFGEKAGDVRDASLKVPPGMKGIVIDTKLFSRKERNEKTREEDKERIALLKKEVEKEVKRIGEARDSQIRELGSEAEKVESIKEKASEMINSVKGRLNLEIDKVNRGDELPPGIVQLVKVYVAQKRKLSVGDKMAGRHGNKGVIAKVVPVEDMPYLPDGTPVDIVLNPLGVPSRINLGQIFETHLGWAAKALGLHIETPVFDGIGLDEIKRLMEEAGLPASGKTVIYDGRTGEPLDNEVTVGYIYMMKLSHLVDDKIHARSIGPYSLVTQQPLGGKAQFGGQRFGEMEVWALEAYGAAYTLQEALTVKSDDVTGRSRTYEAIVKGENPPEPGIPESFNVLIKELESLGLDVKLED